MINKKKWGRCKLEMWRFCFVYNWNGICSISFFSPITAVDLWPSAALWGGNTLRDEKSSKKS